jgi:hypothetical protein
MLQRNIESNIESFEGIDLKGVELSRVAGFSPVTRRANAVQQVRLEEASRLWLEAQEGKLDPYLLRNAFNPTSEVAFKELCHRYPVLFRETMTVSDFDSLTDQVLDRMLLANYQAMPSPWRAFCRVREDIKDFRSVRLYGMDGGADVLEEVGEGEGFNRRSVSQQKWDMSVKKYAAGYGVSWEAIVNDDLGIFNDLPQRGALAVARSVAKFATSLYIDANGPHASLYTGGNGNIIAGSPPFSITALQVAFTQMSQMEDVDGHPITIDMVTLVVCPALEIPARNVLNATELWLIGAEGGAATNQNLHVANWMRAKTNLVVDPYIPHVATSSNGASTWALFANPNQGRPALMVGFLRGFATPALYKKAPNAMRVGGGLDVTHGDFETMSHEYKVVTVYGGTQVDPKYTVASDGSGS